MDISTWQITYKTGRPLARTSKRTITVAAVDVPLALQTPEQSNLFLLGYVAESLGLSDAQAREFEPAIGGCMRGHRCFVHPLLGDHIDIQPWI